ncbi:DUF4256 domain-containing protein [Capnocytophaga sp. ARDL2]|uniref:DUF4256 domain-containing protein n=1 Tax=Capnocytophaga sp. ARDL2 TaxID=3238809 RepID=UPI00355633D5
MELLQILEQQFLRNTHRHKEMQWSEVLNILNSQPKYLEIRSKMGTTINRTRISLVATL